ncbi:hypothetical protein FHT40_004920 [Mycolicibacterium sp. BK556]|uniref:hypothetical protein n=1 Tax=Mycobacteriaceae TaxID=1762 RepID=UPI00105F8D13|nr:MULTISPECIES: hypothetical protein [Mycobacteriaceae]MBB3605236.1 hypothetical protein [Mycolicibacterium sp. BK556]MBB3635432.1 hypothetical protein [Mycolicibacterium sp. BK607]TDO08090.1 hypothetical protein EV580_5661 [Mycobacterium sp. BK086]
MHIAVRSTVATGVALVGASAIALSPIQPVGSVALPLSEVNVSAAVSNVAVELAALPNPIAPWVDVFTAAVTNAGVLGSAWLADPAPILRQTASNWIGYGKIVATALGDGAKAAVDYFTTTFPQALQTAFQQLRDGNPAGAASTLSDAVLGIVLNVGLPFFPVVAIPGQITTNLNAAVQAATGLESLLGLVLGVVGPVGGVIRATGDTAQAFLDAINDKDYSAAAQAFFDLGPNITTAIINGYTTTDGTLYPGLLTPPDTSGFNQGLVYSLLVSIPQAIATAIGAPAPSGAANRAAKSAAAAESAAAPSGVAGSARTARAGAPQASSKKATKADRAAAGAKKSTGAKTSTGAKSARPHRGGSAAG